MSIPDLPILVWIVLFSLIGGSLSVAGAGIVALNARASGVPMLISYAIGAMLGAVFWRFCQRPLRLQPRKVTACNR